MNPLLKKYSHHFVNVLPSSIFERVCIMLRESLEQDYEGLELEEHIQRGLDSKVCHLEDTINLNDLFNNLLECVDCGDFCDPDFNGLGDTITLEKMANECGVSFICWDCYDKRKEAVE